jgi:uncharacterized protein (TIGR03437 family)
MQTRFRFLPLLCLAAAALPAATFAPQGASVTVTTANLQVTFSGADITAVTNLVTGESYLRNPSSAPQLDLALVQAPSTAFTPAGSWTLNSAGSAASLAFTDSNRTVTLAVTVDPVTQEIVLNFDGQAKQGGVKWLAWGLTGFDLTAGQFVLPARGGLTINAASLAFASPYVFNHDAWEVPFLLFQGAQGGLNVYSTDSKFLCKDLVISSNVQQSANAVMRTEAPGPWKSATEAGPIEFRLIAYTGDWQSGARIYRNWRNATLPALPLSGNRAWAANIRTVVEYGDQLPYQSSTLDALAAVVNPTQTLLYLVKWRTNGFDNTFPDYSWNASVPAFISHAHALGFHVMLHTDALGVWPSGPDYPAVQQYQIRDPLNLSLQGWEWNLPPSTPNRYAIINPAAKAWRQLYLARVSPAIQTLQPDAIHLDFSASFNDGNGLIEGLSYNQGFVQLQKDLLAAFPNLVLGTEECFDAFAPLANFSQPLYWSSGGLSPAATPPVPVAAYAVPNLTRYWHLGTTNPNDAGFVTNLAQYEGQAVLPTFHTEIASYTQPDIARFFNVISAFEKYNLSPAWDTPWNGAVIKYQGTGGTAATLTDTGSIVQFTLQPGSGSPATLYTRAHGVNQIDSPLSVPGWPAFNGTLTLGLDPSTQYWLDNTPRPSSLPHVTSLPGGARLGLAAGTLVASPFSYFQILPPAAKSGFDFFANLVFATAGVTYQGADFPLANGATANLTTITVGGVSRQGLFCQTPVTAAQVGSETFVEYSVPVPAAGAQLSFAAGIADFALGNRSDPMTFKVEVNGAILWEQDIFAGGWQSGSLDMTPWAGLTVRIRFVSNPGPNGNAGWASGAWSSLQLSSSATATLSGITVNVPQGAAPSNVVTAGAAAVSGNNVTVNALPPGGTIVLFTGSPSQVSSGQTLLTLPFTLAQGSNAQLASVGPPAYLGTGTTGPVTSGGVTKQALNAFGPPNGQTILSWLLQPTSSLDFSFAAGFWDNVGPPFAQGYLMSVRVNGVTLWQRNINVPPAWQPGALDLSAWAGQPMLLELITDTLGSNTDDFTSWGDVSFTSAASPASCIATIPSASQSLNINASGGSIPVAVTIASNCDWASYSPADWISASPSTTSGSRSASISVAPNLGPKRQSWVAVAGNIVTVAQAAAASTGPEISLVSAIAGGAQTTAPNTWLAIYGINLSTTVRPWQSSDFVNGQMPTQLDGVSATINGKPAFVEYVSPTQVNILTPLDSAQGSVQITVTSGGVTSAPVWIPMQAAAAPGFFQFSGVSYVAATHAAGTLLGPATLYPGASTPAQPGEVVTIYGSGFGQTTLPLVNGALAQSGALPTPLPVFTVSGVPAEVRFAGVVAAGLYQFNIKIPQSAPDGDNTINATYAGSTTQAGALISVHH